MKKIKILFGSLLLLMSLTIISCGDDNNPTDNNPKFASKCEECHTDYARLKTVFTPDTGSGGSSCGGETPHYEPFDRVHMGGSGYESFKKTKHYEMGCVGCHNGDAQADDKNLAHSKGFMSHPSKDSASVKCKSCHESEVANHKNSLHQMGWGQKRKVCVRMGLKDATEFDKLPNQVKAGYEYNCAKCHASSCGDCHINRPKAQGGGLMDGHKFAAKPDMVNVCVGCHTSRGGHAYLGIASGTLPDVHLSKAGFKCTNCHSKDEIHGTGQFVEQRYKYNKLPKCTDCHPSLETKNVYHSNHFNTFSCNTCHSQNYNNCGSCHINGAGARMLSYQDFKIALNPIPDAKPGFKYSIVRHTLMAPDSWSLYGVPNLSNFNALPVFNYATPHNTLRWTSRTKVESGKKCSDNCHIVKEGVDYRNKNLYLFDSDFKFDWERSSSSQITVDGKLPVEWFK